MMKKLIILAVIAFSSLTMAASSDDEGMAPVGACMVVFDDDNSYKLINVNYIRLLKIDKKDDTVVKIHMASNYYSGGTDAFSFKYNSSLAARHAADSFARQINNCRKK